MKVWISKYALTKGVFETEAEFCIRDQSMIKEVRPNFFGVPSYYHTGDFHLDHDRAVKKANEMRLRKIAVLKKHLKKLEVPFA